LFWLDTTITAALAAEGLAAKLLADDRSLGGDPIRPKLAPSGR
jgi:hypothetical protein